MLRIIEKVTGEEYNVILEKVSDGGSGGLYECAVNSLGEFMNNYVDVKNTRELETGDWNNYIQYLKDWARQHEEIENEGMSPVCYDEFLDNESEVM